MILPNPLLLVSPSVFNAQTAILKTFEKTGVETDGLRRTAGSACLDTLSLLSEQRANRTNADSDLHPTDERSSLIASFEWKARSGGSATRRDPGRGQQSLVLTSFKGFRTFQEIHQHLVGGFRHTARIFAERWRHSDSRADIAPPASDIDFSPGREKLDFKVIEFSGSRKLESRA